ncbi:hypothetical protein QCA50_001378 [Cerrena zonata]|uniref:Formamidopyrimidine-DNA glycosylase catalytic domain-containing protein n=1 Tax=Cerrena zonata TaxID=2478898 RepID=A0AAW0GKU0_9APHY
MPELPEAEKAAKLLRDIAAGKVIIKVETTEDNIVYSGTDHLQFAKELTDRKVIDAARYGKVFYLTLDGHGGMPVLHFGMTGMLQVKGDQPTHYRSSGTTKKAASDWPPRFMKFILHLKDEASDSVTEVAFLDARRLARIRLCASPLTEPPISNLGFDPIISMASLPDLQTAVLKRSCPIKALLLDQSFSAGIGNWVADEVLYHARVHPERRCNTLTAAEIEALHDKIQYVCKTAVAVNADDSKFPENWLFKHRWGKGKKKDHTLTLPSGQLATIKWIKVGGRTSAYVAELQKLTPSREAEVDDSSRETDEESDLTPLEEDEPEVVLSVKRKRQTKPKVTTTATTSQRKTKRSKFFK